MFDLGAALRRVLETGGSDLHLKVPAPAIIRTQGKLEPVPGCEPLAPEVTEAVLGMMLNNPKKMEEFQRDNEVDFSYALPGMARFRVNAFRQRGSVSIVCRAIPFTIRTVDDLMLPPVINDIAEEERGIVLLTGTTGSGKSTTLAAMIDRINTTMSKHIVTIEDPVEFLHKDKMSIINQREVGEDTGSFKLGPTARSAPGPRRDPGGRDARRGDGAHRAVRRRDRPPRALHRAHRGRRRDREPHHRLLPDGEQRQARAMLAGTLKGVISQRLVPTPDGDGRVATCEILRMTGRVKDMILNPEETGKLPEVIKEGAYYGMQTFDQALLAHVKAGRVSMEHAMKAATAPHDFKLLVASQGQALQLGGQRVRR